MPGQAVSGSTVASVDPGESWRPLDRSFFDRPSYEVATDLRDYLPLAGLFVLIPALCLLLWAALGAWLARWLVHPQVRRGVDIVMGALLVACAFLLLIEP